MRNIRRKEEIVQILLKFIQESQAVVSEDALHHILFLLQYCPLRSFQVNDFHVILNPSCHFLLVINNNVCHISYRFRDTATYGSIQGHPRSSMTMFMSLQNQHAIFYLSRTV